MADGETLACGIILLLLRWQYLYLGVEDQCPVDLFHHYVFPSSEWIMRCSRPSTSMGMDESTFIFSSGY